MITKLKVPGYYDGEYSESNILEVVEKLNELIDLVKQHRIDCLVSSGFERDELNELLQEKND